MQEFIICLAKLVCTCLEFQLDFSSLFYRTLFRSPLIGLAKWRIESEILFIRFHVEGDNVCESISIRLALLVLYARDP